jgi:hypothetical protein
VLGEPLLVARARLAAEPQTQRGSDLRGDPVLDARQLRGGEVVALAPVRSPVLDADELDRDAETGGVLADRAHEEAIGLERLAGLLEVGSLSLVAHDGRCGPDLQWRHVREMRDDVVGEAEPHVPFRVRAAHDLKRQDGQSHRGTGGRRAPRNPRAKPGRRNDPDHHGEHSGPSEPGPPPQPNRHASGTGEGTGQGKRLLELDPGIRDVVQAPRPVLLQAPLDKRAHGLRCRRGQRLRVRLPLEDRDERVRPVAGGEGAASTQQLEEEAPKRPDVGALVQRLPAGLLGAHVGCRSENCSLLCERGASGHHGVPVVPRERPGQAEVEELDPAFGGDLHVRGLQVPMDHSCTVGRLESPGDLARDVERFPQGERPPRKPLGQRDPRHQLHDEAPRPAVLLEPVDGRDVRVAQGGEAARLLLESLEALRVVPEALGEHLDRHLAAQAGVPRPVHLSHAPFAERAQHPQRTEGSAGQCPHAGL